MPPTSCIVAFRLKAIVRPVVAEDAIVAGAAVERVIAPAARHGIERARADEGVVARVAAKGCGNGSRDAIVSIPAAEQVDSFADDDVISTAAADVVGSLRATQGIPSAVAGNLIIPAAADDAVVAVSAGERIAETGVRFGCV